MCGKFKSKINAYIYSKYGINKNMVRLSRNLDMIKNNHRDNSSCLKCGKIPCNCTLKRRIGDSTFETKIKF